MTAYRRTNDFTEAQLAELFLSVGWESGKAPDRLRKAFLGSNRVISAWDDTRLVGLIRGLDDGIWQATIDCLLVHAAYQGRGIADCLMRLLLKDYEAFLYVDVVPDEKRNVAFYEKYGFRVMEHGTPLQRKGASWDG